MTSQAPEALDYAPAPGGRGRRRVTRLIAFAVLALLVTWGALKSDQLLRWMQQKQRMWAEMRRYDACATYDVPSDLVVWEEDPAEIQRLIDPSSQMLRYSRNVSNWTGRHAATIDPWPWRDLGSTARQCRRLASCSCTSARVRPGTVAS